MIPQVEDMVHKQGFVVWLRFEDGVAGEIDLEAELEGPIFEPLKDPAIFSRMRLDPELNTLVWPNGADFAPEFLYRKLCPEYRLGAEARSGVA